MLALAGCGNKFRCYRLKTFATGVVLSRVPKIGLTHVDSWV